MQNKNIGFYEAHGKRILDILCATAAILVFWWLYLIVALLVRVKLGSPVLFRQERPGKNEKIFTLYKFRTMTEERDERGELLPDTMRLTRFGKLLRATSLDELPEVLNILKGDMSVVGPRPLLVKYLPYYKENEHCRHNVRPGLSGWAQVNGRTTCGWEKKFMYDLEYVQNISFFFDLKIILKSIKAVFIHQDNAVDTTETEGNLAEIRKKETDFETSGSKYG